MPSAFKRLNPHVKVAIIYVIGIVCLIFPLYILDHEWMRGLIHKLDEHTRTYDLYALVIYAFLWYIPLIIGISILTFLTLGLLYVYIKNKLKG